MHRCSPYMVRGSITQWLFTVAARHHHHHWTYLFVCEQQYTAYNAYLTVIAVNWQYSFGTAVYRRSSHSKKVFIWLFLFKNSFLFSFCAHERATHSYMLNAQYCGHICALIAFGCLVYVLKTKSERKILRKQVNYGQKIY